MTDLYYYNNFNLYIIPVSTNKTKAKAIYSFTGEDSTELSFKVCKSIFVYIVAR